MITKIRYKNLVVAGTRLFSSASPRIQVGNTCPKKMRFMAHDTSIGPSSFKIQECDMPEYYPEKGEVLIKVEATAVNRGDLLQSYGKYPPPRGVTEIIGLECSGYLVDPETQEITDKKVMALLSGGGYAQFVKVKKDHVMSVPEGMSFEEAAAIPEAWATAYQLLFQVAKIQEDETALVLAGASGVGTSMIQLIKMAGAHSIAISSSHSKLQICKDLGSFDSINYKQIPTYSERVMMITDGEGVDVIQDPVLGTFFNCNLNCLGMDSRWVIYGTMGGYKIKEANLMKLIGKRASILTSTLRNRSDPYKKDLLKDMERDCWPAFESGQMKPIIDKVYNLSDAGEALGYMQQNLNIGKIILSNNL